MKSGIIRRIDDLGRIVIPKEIRRSLRISEGDPMEISIENNGVVLDKYEPLYEFKAQAKIYLNAFFSHCKAPIALCDRYEVIATAGVPIALNSRISETVEFHINETIEYLYGTGTDENTSVPVVEGLNFYANAILPITDRVEKQGGLVLIRQADEVPTEEQIHCARFLAGLIANQLAL